ncbi:MAG: bifunctional nuclease family protein [Lentisphaeria bacterium]
MIPVNVGNLSISNVGFVVFLKSEQSEKTIPIFIGGPEAQAIALKLNGVSTPRPMTHDLIKNIFDVFEARLERVIIYALREGTFLAQLIANYEGQTTQIDARPSDAIALALRFNAPIFVSEEVMEEAGVRLDEQELKGGNGKEGEEEEEKDELQLLQEELDKAISEERYEDAANLRDKIRKTTTSN